MHPLCGHTFGQMKQTLMWLLLFPGDPARGVNAGHNFVQMEAGFQRSQSYRIPPTDRGAKDLSRSQSVTPTDDTAR